ncbi:MAG TPA: alpha-(1-_3)-arabinofuranosyltransferase family protein, partial [Acidimicrobiales bacterium]
MAYIPLLASKPGMIEADTKQYLYINPGKLLSGASTLWDPNVGMGTVTHQNIGYLFPMGPFFWVFNAIGVPVWVAQRLWIGTLLFAAGMGMLFLVRTLAADGTARRTGAAVGDGTWRSTVTIGTRWGTPAVTVAALAFMLSPYVLQYEARISALLMPWAALPWLVAFVARALRVGGWRYPALFALVTAITGAVNATSIVYVLIAPLLWFPYAVWILREVTLRRALVVLVRMGVLTALLSLWWLAGLATQAGYGLDVLRYSETVQAVASASLSYDILRGFGFWYFYGQDGIGPWIQASVDFTRWPWLLLVSYAVPATAFVAAIVIRWRHRLYFIALIGIGVAIAVGVHPYDHPAAPLGSLLKSFATGSTAGLALRNVARAIPLLALGFAMLLAAGVEALSAWWSRLGIVAAVAIGGLVAADMAPLWAGQFVDANLSRPTQLPSYYQAAANYMDAQGNATRVMALPGIDFASYRWGNNLVDPVEPGILSRPFVAREQVPWGSPPSADLLMALDDRLQQGTFDPTSLAPLARLMGIGEVELRSDLQYERYLTARTLPTAAQFNPTPPGLSQPVSFGPPASLHTSVPLVDEQTLGPSATTPDPADLEVYGVTDPRSILRAEPAQQPLVVAGNGDALVNGASAGLLNSQQTVLYQGDLDTNASAERQALNAGADLVLTDTNRRRAERWDTITQNTGYTEQAGETPPEPDPNNNPLPLFPDATDNSRTVTQQGGAASVQASGYGNPVSYTPANRPDLAMDGDLSTAWEVQA